MAKQIIEVGDDIEHLYPGQYRGRRWLGRVAAVAAIALLVAAFASWRASALSLELGSTQVALAGHVAATAACRAERDALEAHGRAQGGELASCRAEVDRIGGVQREESAALTALRANQPATAEEIEALRQQRAEGAAQLAALEDLEERLDQMIDVGKLRVRARRGSLVVALPSDALFGPGVAQLSRPGELALMELAVVLKKLPADRRFLVVGHTDDQPPVGGAFADDWQLSTAQGLAVAQFLVTAGMRPEHLQAGGHGRHDPEASNRTVDGRTKNRRVEVQIVPAFTGPPLPTPATAPTPSPAR